MVPCPEMSPLWLPDDDDDGDDEMICNFGAFIRCD